MYKQQDMLHIRQKLGIQSNMDFWIINSSTKSAQTRAVPHPHGIQQDWTDFPDNT